MSDNDKDLQQQSALRRQHRLSSSTHFRNVFPYIRQQQVDPATSAYRPMESGEGYGEARVRRRSVFRYLHLNNQQDGHSSTPVDKRDLRSRLSWQREVLCSALNPTVSHRAKLFGESRTSPEIVAEGERKESGSPIPGCMPAICSDSSSSLDGSDPSCKPPAADNTNDSAIDLYADMLIIDHPPSHSVSLLRSGNLHETGISDKAPICRSDAPAITFIRDDNRIAKIRARSVDSAWRQREDTNRNDVAVDSPPQRHKTDRAIPGSHDPIVDMKFIDPPKTTFHRSSSSANARSGSSTVILNYQGSTVDSRPELLPDPHVEATATLPVSAPTTAVSEHFLIDRMSLSLVEGIPFPPLPTSARLASSTVEAQQVFEEAFSSAVFCISDSTPQALKVPTSSQLHASNHDLVGQRPLARDTGTVPWSPSPSESAAQTSRCPTSSVMAEFGTSTPCSPEQGICWSHSFVEAGSEASSCPERVTSAHSRRTNGETYTALSGLSAPHASSRQQGLADPMKSAGLSPSEVLEKFSSISRAIDSDHSLIKGQCASVPTGDECEKEELRDPDMSLYGQARYIELDISPSSTTTINSGSSSDESPHVLHRLNLRLRERSEYLEGSESAAFKRDLPPIRPAPTCALPSVPRSARSSGSTANSLVGGSPARTRSLVDVLSRRDSPVIGPRRRPSISERRSPPESRSAYFAQTYMSQDESALVVTPPGSGSSMSLHDTSCSPCPPRPPKNPRRPSAGTPRFSINGIRNHPPPSASVGSAPPSSCIADAVTLSSSRRTIDAATFRSGRAVDSGSPSMHSTLPLIALPSQSISDVTLKQRRQASIEAVKFWREDVPAGAPVHDRMHKMNHGLLEHTQSLLTANEVMTSSSLPLSASLLNLNEALQQVNQLPQSRCEQRQSPWIEGGPLLHGRGGSDADQAGQHGPVVANLKKLASPVVGVGLPLQRTRSLTVLSSCTSPRAASANGVSWVEQVPVAPVPATHAQEIDGPMMEGKVIVSQPAPRGEYSLPPPFLATNPPSKGRKFSLSSSSKSKEYSLDLHRKERSRTKENSLLPPAMTMQQTGTISNVDANGIRLSLVASRYDCSRSAGLVSGYSSPSRSSLRDRQRERSGGRDRREKQRQRGAIAQEEQLGTALRGREETWISAEVGGGTLALDGDGRLSMGYPMVRSPSTVVKQRERIQRI